MDDFLNMESGQSPRDVLGKDLSLSKPNTRGLSLDFKKLNKFGKELTGKDIEDRASTIKKLSKTPRLKPESLLDWVKPNSLDLSPEKEVLFQSKQNKSTRFKCDGSGDFAGATGVDKTSTVSDNNDIQITKEIKPRKRNVHTNLETRFSGVVASPLDQDMVELHVDEGVGFSPVVKKTIHSKKATSATERKSNPRSTHTRVVPSQEFSIQKKELEEKIAKEKEELAHYQVRMEIKQLQATLELLKKEEEGTLPGSQIYLDNNAFRVDYLDDQVLQKPQVLNLVQVVNKLNDVLGNKKCLSLLKPWAWLDLKPMTNQYQSHTKH